MAAQRNLPRVPDNVTFRVLIVGRANAGKTSILKRVCDTTDSPEVYKLGRRRQFGRRRERVPLEPTTERGEHDIEDELVFANHRSYVFHDSRGFEAGNQDELNTVQEFVRRKSRERRLGDRLHAIWYCIPMDNSRPELEMRFLHNICPDQNVPVIVVFTKFDQFKRDIMLNLVDQGRDQSHLRVEDEVERIFGEHYRRGLEERSLFVRLEKMDRPGQDCTPLIEMTANALSGDVVALLLVAAQKSGLELSINQAVKRAHAIGERGGSIDEVIKECILAFPSLWHLVSLSLLV